MRRLTCHDGERFFRRHPAAVWARFACLLVLAYAGAAAPAAGQEVTYSDAWASGAYEGEYDTPELTDGYVNGCGVTEEDYTSYSSYKVESWLRSPSGRYSNAVSYGSGSTRADVFLAVNLESPEEGDYTVQTNHYESEYNSSPEGPSAQISYFPMSYSYAVGSLGAAAARFTREQSMSSVGADWLYTRQCQSSRCPQGNSRFLRKDKYPFPPTYVNWVGFRFSIFGYGFCTGKNIPSNWPGPCI